MPAIWVVTGDGVGPDGQSHKISALFVFAVDKDGKMRLVSRLTTLDDVPEPLEHIVNGTPVYAQDLSTGGIVDFVQYFRPVYDNVDGVQIHISVH